MAHRKTNNYFNLSRWEIHNHYRTQKSIYEQKTEGKTALNKVEDFLEVKVWGWIYHYIKSRFGGKYKFVDYKNKKSNGIFSMISEQSGDKNKVKIILASDWATDTPESDAIGDRMKQEKGDYTIHLGDTYFVGTPDEIDSNFTAENASWPIGTSGSLAIPGNHEFYSNGKGYYENLLKKMYVKTNDGTVNQEASFFCLENDYWRILGLDTGYHSVGLPVIEFIFKPDAHFNETLMKWLKDEVHLNAPDDYRGIIILTHHQYFSAFEKQYIKPAEQLKSFIGTDKEILWFWGHEHRFAVYGKYSNGLKTFGRCIGHSGMPIELGSKKSSPDPKNLKKFNLVLYDNRSKTKDGKLGHNGYAILNLDHEKLLVEYMDESTWIFKESWEIDIPTGKMKGICIENNPDINLKLCASSYDESIK